MDSPEVRPLTPVPQRPLSPEFTFFRTDSKVTGFYLEFYLQIKIFDFFFAISLWVYGYSFNSCIYYFTGFQQFFLLPVGVLNHIYLC